MTTYKGPRPNAVYRPTASIALVVVMLLSGLSAMPSAAARAAESPLPPTFRVPTNYNLTFNESGLPLIAQPVGSVQNGNNQTPPIWTVMIEDPAGIGLELNNSTNSFVGFSVPNGTYSFVVENFSVGQLSYLPDPANGTLTVNGSAVTVNVGFAKSYALEFVEFGSPLEPAMGAGLIGSLGWTWSVSVTNTTDGVSQQLASVNDTDFFGVVNGSYTYQILPSAYLGLVYDPDPSSGVVTVAGLAESVNITFSPGNGSAVNGSRAGTGSGAGGSSEIDFNAEPNWGGYVDCTPSGCGSDLSCSDGVCTPTSTSMVGAEATFTLPYVVNSTSGKSYPEAISIWVGIGGVGTSDLIQAGFTEFFLSGNSRNAPDIWTWYEMNPAVGSTNVPFSPHMGDTMTVSIFLVSDTGGTQEWSFSIYDQTDHSSWNADMPCSGSSCVPSQFGAADFIVECPNVGSASGKYPDGELAMLPAYTPVEFTNAAVYTGYPDSTWKTLASTETTDSMQAVGQSYVLASESVPYSYMLPDGQPYYLQYGALPSDLYEESGTTSYFYVQYLASSYGLGSNSAKFDPNPVELTRTTKGTVYLLNPSGFAANPTKKKDEGIAGADPIELALVVSIAGASGPGCTNSAYTPSGAALGVSGAISALLEVNVAGGCSGVSSGTYSATFTLYWVSGGLGLDSDYTVQLTPPLSYPALLTVSCIEVDGKKVCSI